MWLNFVISISYLQLWCCTFPGRLQVHSGPVRSVNGARMQDKSFPTLLAFFRWARLRWGSKPGWALLMQPKRRQIESDTCVCRMVFVVTLWLQIIKCLPRGDFALQAPQMKLTFSERETEETRVGGWRDRRALKPERSTKKTKMKWEGWEGNKTEIEIQREILLCIISVF